MSRNDQVTRQWYLLRRLESPRGATLQELAETLPADYPKHPRTVRRDLEALAAAGFPLLTERADGQTRWKLIEVADQPVIEALAADAHLRSDLRHRLALCDLPEREESPIDPGLGRRT